MGPKPKREVWEGNARVSPAGQSVGINLANVLQSEVELTGIESILTMLTDRAAQGLAIPRTEKVRIKMRCSLLAGRLSIEWDRLQRTPA